ncbi:MAG TPA: type II toxin-antitoxin system RelE/ParE family toxin [bacterium]|nr:type II toxin-antitoxin system RelE/ParE family toxin [bacterium]
MRQGDWRIIYRVDDGNKAVVIVKIGHRRDVYR